MFEIVDRLPKVPDEFLLTEKQIRKLQCLNSEFLDYGYATFLPENEEEMVSHFSAHFDSDIVLRYQLITKDLPAHQDVCKQDWKMNYVYQTGGDSVITSWGSTAVQCDPFVWYKLNVREHHSVSGVQSPRLSITLKLL